MEGFIVLVGLAVASVPILCIVILCIAVQIRNDFHRNLTDLDRRLGELCRRVGSSPPRKAEPYAAQRLAVEEKREPVVKTPVEKVEPEVKAPAETQAVEVEETVFTAMGTILKKSAPVADIPNPKAPPVESAKPTEAVEAKAKPEVKTVYKRPEPSAFETRAHEILQQIWMWIIVGSDYRKQGVSAEYAVATAWLVRIGIIILLTGVGFFLKLSIERNLISPGLRVCLTGLTGIGMVIGGLRMIGKKYDLIGHGIAGGGSVILYFTVFAAMQMYHLVEFMPAFILMVIITACVGVLSVRFNSLFMALLGLLGGYLTPVMLSTGVKHLEGLYGYVLLLGIATLFVARYRDWKLLNFLSFIFTYAIYFAALRKFYVPDQDFPTAITFLCLYFVLFSAQTIIYNIVRKLQSSIIELAMLLINTAVFYIAGYMLVIKLYSRGYMAILSLGAALFFLGHMLFFLKRRIKDRNLMIMLTGFSAFSVIITFPLILSGQWITAAWAVLAVMGLWMSLKLKSNFLRFVAYIIYGLTLFRLFTFDRNGFAMIYSTTAEYWQLFLDRFLSLGMITLSGLAGYFLLKHEEGGDARLDPDNDLPVKLYRNVGIRFFFWASFVLIAVYLQIEFYRLGRFFYQPMIQPLVSVVWTAAALFMLGMYLRAKEKVYLTVMFIVLTVLAFKLFVIDGNAWNFAENFTYRTATYPLWALMRALDFLPMLGVLLLGCRLPDGKPESVVKAFGWFFAGMLFFYTTFELNTFLFEYLPGFRFGGISILWGIFALACITRGIKKQAKGMRYAGLVLFLIVALKVFFVDLRSLSQIYRIIAFIIMGLVILGGAVIYIRFKDSFGPAAGAMPAKENKENE